MKIQINSIKIAERQRLDMGDVSELADSLTRLGQIHNIGIRAEDNQLVWGMRRFLAAKSLGWTEIEATVREGLSYENEQEIELEEDCIRKDRTWQERALSIAKLYRIKNRQHNGTWGYREMAEYLNEDKMSTYYLVNIADGLEVTPKDEELWAATGMYKAIEVLKNRVEKQATNEIERRREANQYVAKQVEALKISHPKIFADAASPVSNPNQTPLKKLSLAKRASLYNKAYEHLGPPNTRLFYENKNNREFITGFWFVGGANISDLYGSYQIEYLRRIGTLFPDSRRTIHLFVGNIPASENYLRVGLPQGDTHPDIECDAHELSSKLPFKCDLIYADPPYSIEDSEHYQSGMVNREKVLEECALVLNEDGFIVWIDQALPVFKNELLQFVGAIGYIRSTGNRFRIVSLFRKAKTCLSTESKQETQPTNSPSPLEPLQKPPIA
jgi:ParB-like nuclease domain